ncbi:MAG: ECF-type sigma factor, partial [Salinivenus sp.]
MTTSTSPNDELGRTASMSDSASDVTRLLVRLRSGEDAALDELLPAVYDALRDIARNQLRGERADHTLRTTELVHEAYMKLVDHETV